MKFNESLSDERLMKAYQNGVDGAFDLLFKRYSSRVYGFLMNRLKNRVQADDVFQATFLKLHQARHHYDPLFPFASWLFTICKSVLTDHARKNVRIKEDANEEFISCAVDGKSIEYANHPAVALEKLSADQQAAIKLRYLEELRFEEIAQRLETSPLNARKLVSRGIEKLKVLNEKKRRES